jgi:uncharacterized protein (TIGR03435 family)
LPLGPFNMKGGDPVRIAWTNTRLIRVLQMAYDVVPDQISGPGWLGSEMYDVLATMPPGTTVADFKRMVQSLLAERFKLTVHREIKEVSGYWLEVAPGGLKMKESKSDPQPAAAGASKSDPAINAPAGTFVDKSGFPAPLPDNPLFPPGAGFAATIRVNDLYRATVSNFPLPEIAKFLEPAAAMPIQDRTGLTGKYGFHLEYKPDLPSVTADGGAADIGAPGPGLLDAVQSQLGLKLVRQKVPREMLVIDHAERIPTGNERDNQ